MDEIKVPIYLMTDFLESGKILHLDSAHQSVKSCVIDARRNDFGR
mgnify:CR=1 FL=1